MEPTFIVPDAMKEGVGQNVKLELIGARGGLPHCLVRCAAIAAAQLDLTSPIIIATVPAFQNAPWLLPGML